MPSSKPKSVPLPDTEAASPLADALDRSEQVQKEAGFVATELTVLNTVLKQEIPAHVQAGDVAQALKKNGEIEHRIQKSADELAVVNQLLEQEIDERVLLEQELAITKKQLAQVERKVTAR